MFRVVMVFLVEYQTSIRRKRQQPFRGLHILYLGMVQAAAELPIFQQRCCTDEQQQHQAEDADIPERQAVAYIVIAQHQGSSSRSTKPTPRTVCRSLFWNSPSSLRRSL